MAGKAYPPLFLTGKLPKRNSEEIIWLILCVKKMGIVLPKDIYRYIYDFLRIVKHQRQDIYILGKLPYFIMPESGDFAIIKPLTNCTLSFDGLKCQITSGNTYFLCSGIQICNICISGDEGTVSIDYWSFADRETELFRAYNVTVSEAMNTNIDTRTLQYVLTYDGSPAIRLDSSLLVVLSPLRHSDAWNDIYLCRKHDLICYETSMPEVGNMYKTLRAERGIEQQTYETSLF